MKYLASPYTHPDPLVREQRFLAAAEALQHLLRNKIWTYSPIVHCHELSKIWGMPHDAAFWEEYDSHMVELSTGIFVLMLPGWGESVGVKGEIQLAIKLGLTITYLSPGSFDAQVEIGGNRHQAKQAAAGEAAGISAGTIDKYRN